MIKRADSARGAPAPLRISCRVASSRSHGRILVAPFPDGNPLVTASVAAHSSHPIIGRRFWSESFASQVSTSRVATQLGVFRLRHRPLLSRGSSSFRIDSAKDTSRHPIAFHRTGDTAVYTVIQRVSHRGDQPSFLVADTLFVRCLVHR